MESEIDRLTVMYEIASFERDNCEMICDRVKEMHRKVDAFELEKQDDLLAGLLRYELDIVNITVQNNGTAQEKQRIADIDASARKATESRQRDQVDALLHAERLLYNDVVGRIPAFWTGLFEALCRDSRSSSWSDEFQARRLIEQGKEIISHGYDDAIKEIVCKLNTLKRDCKADVIREDVLEARG